MSEVEKEIRRELETAVEDYCDACMSNDGLCTPLSPENKCEVIAPIKEHIAKLDNAAD